jgi:hypothetical protein
LWLGLFVALGITNGPAFGAAMGLLACALCIAIATNWRGMAEELWRGSLWPRYEALTLLLFRRAIGIGGFVIAAVVTILFLAASLGGHS